MPVFLGPLTPINFRCEDGTQTLNYKGRKQAETMVVPLSC